MTAVDTVPARPSLGVLPARIQRLPVDHRGYPVPWFVAWVDGKPDFRVIEEGKMVDAHNHKRCWICGQRLGTYLAFVIGPMCLVNFISSEPPSHRECAEFAARFCPFLAKPMAVRRDANLPSAIQPAAGTGLKRNPGVTLVLITKSYRPFNPQQVDRRANPGTLFRIGEPIKCLWYREGRAATRDEVRASVESGLPLLMDGMPAGASLVELQKALDKAQRWFPAEAAPPAETPVR